MTQSFQELTRSYAEAQGARCAWFLRAQNVAEAIAKLGLIGPGDRLVMRATDATDEFCARFGARSLSFAADLTPEAYVAATNAHAHPVSQRFVEGHASYADGAGASFDQLYWFVESIGCRGLRVPDIRALAEAARRVGAILLVDNTVPSSWGCHPLELGAHIAFEALDRVAGGSLNAPVVGIAVARDLRGRGRRAQRDDAGRKAYCLLAQRLGGEMSHAVSDIDERDVAAIADGLSSLAERMQRHADCARVVAEYLAANPAVASVGYPGLKSHPDFDIAARALMHGFGPAVDFELPDCARAGAFIAACSCSNRTHPAGGRLTRLSPLCGDESHYIRLFAGLDDPLDIVDSLEQALRLFCNPPHA